MKTKIFILITLLFIVAATSAQTFLYTHNSTHTGRDANGSTFTYRSVIDGALVDLHNVANTRTNAEQRFRDGSPLTQRILLGQERLLEPDNWTWNRSRSIVNNAFSADERRRVTGCELLVDLIIDSNTGRIMEVEFSFLANSGFATIPVSVYRRIELELKNQIWFTPTAVGRSLNFIARGWSQEVR